MQWQLQQLWKSTLFLVIVFKIRKNATLPYDLKKNNFFGYENAEKYSVQRRVK